MPQVGRRRREHRRVIHQGEVDAAMIVENRAQRRLDEQEALHPPARRNVVVERVFLEPHRPAEAIPAHHPERAQDQRPAVRRAVEVAADLFRRAAEEVRARLGEERVDVGDPREEVALRRAQGHLERVRVERLHGEVGQRLGDARVNRGWRDPARPGLQHRARAGDVQHRFRFVPEERAPPAEDEVLRGQRRLPVAPDEVAAQMERVDLPGRRTDRRHLPARRERGHHLVVPTESGQAPHHRVDDRIVGRRRLAGSAPVQRVGQGRERDADFVAAGAAHAGRAAPTRRPREDERDEASTAHERSGEHPRSRSSLDCARDERERHPAGSRRGRASLGRRRGQTRMRALRQNLCADAPKSEPDT